MTSRLEELRAKYDGPFMGGLDPYPVAAHGRRYNNGNRGIFQPRARYAQDWDDYEAIRIDIGYGTFIWSVDGTSDMHAVSRGSEEWPDDDD